MKVIRALFLMLVLLCAEISQAAIVQYRNILQKNDVQSLTYDEYNRLWVGYANGFSIINNSIVTSYSSVEIDGSEEIIYNVRLIVPFDDEALIITQDKLLLYNAVSESFSEILLSGNSIAPDAACLKGNLVYLYYGAENCLVSYDIHSGVITIISTFNDYDHFAFTKIVDANQEQDILLLAEENRGVYEYSISSGRLRHIDSIPEDIVPSTLTVFNGNVYLSSTNNGLNCYSINQDYRLIAQYSETSPSKITSNAVTSCCIDATDNLLYIGTDDGGVNKLDLVSGTVLAVYNSPLTHSISGICNIGPKSVICSLSNNGLVSIQETFVKILSKTSPDENSVLSNSSVFSILPFPNGHIYLGTDGGGINSIVVNKEDNSIISYAYPATRSENVTSMAVYDSHRIICVVKHKGFFLFDVDKKSFERIRFPFIDEHMYRKRSFDNLMVTGNGDFGFYILNAGNDNFCYSPQTGKYEKFTYQMDGSVDWIHSAHSSQYHTIFQTDNALYEINNRTLRVRQLYKLKEHTQHITCSNLIQDGSVLFAVNKTLYRYSTNRSELFELCTLENKNASIRSICRYKDGSIWMTLSDGDVVSYQIEDNTFINYPASDFEDNTFTSSFSFNYDDYLFFPGISGLLALNPSNKNDFIVKSVIPVSVVSMTVNDTPVKLNKKNVVRAQSSQNLAIRILIENGDPLRANMIRYTLRSTLNDDVFEIESKNPYLEIPRLKQGRYSLYVSVKSLYGWQKPEKIATLFVHRSLFLAPIAVILYVIIFIIVVIMIYRYYQNKKIRAMEYSKFEYNQERSDKKIERMGRIVHDLRSPLLIVMNRINSVLPSLKDDQQTYNKLHASLSQIDKMSEMITSVLKQMNSDNVEEQIVLKYIRLNDWINEAIQNFSVRCESKGLTIKFIADASLSVVNIDETCLESCFRNLMTNAIKYSDSGQITVSTRRSSGRFRISVSDQGRGFSCDASELFNKYYRENSDDKVQGFGIGLSSVKAITDFLGGAAGAENNKDCGATFWFEFPFMDNDEEKISLPQSALFNFDTTKYSLLIVDSDAENVNYLSKEFKFLFNKIMSVNSYDAAFDYLKDNETHMILCCDNISDVSGKDFCSAIKNRLSVSHIPVALYSERIEHLLKIDPLRKDKPDFMFSKPFDVKRIYQSIKDILIKRRLIKDKFILNKKLPVSECETFSVADERFVLELNKFLMEQKGRHEGRLTLSAVGEQLGISAEMLVFKIKVLTDLDANDFIVEQTA